VRLTAKVVERVLLAVGFAGGAAALTPLAAPWTMNWDALAESVVLAGVETTATAGLVGLVVFTAAAYALGLTALRFLSAPIAGAMGYTEVVIAALAAWALLGERLTAPQIIGGVVVLAGVLTAQRAVAAKHQAESELSGAVPG
jgi:drug/metabolite transporter (DMT)-like permease